MEQRGNRFQVEWHTLQRAECPRRTLIQAIEPEAAYVLLASGGKVLRNHAGYAYEEYGYCPWPTLLIVWPPHTLSVYLAPAGQEDDMTIFRAALLPGSRAEWHLTYEYRPFFLFGSFEEFLTLRVARVRIFAESEAGDESQSS